MVCLHEVSTGEETMPPTDPSTVSAVKPYVVTILCAAVVALCGVIAYLFKHYSGKQDTQDKERIVWAVERSKFDEAREKYEAQLRAEYEEKHRLIIETHAKSLSEIHDAARAHEDQVRREYAQSMNAVADKAAESTEKIAAVLDKMYSRYVGPRSRNG